MSRIRTLLIFAIGSAIGYLVGSYAQKKMDENRWENVKEEMATTMAESHTEKAEELKKEREEFEKEKEQFHKVKMDWANEVIKEEQIKDLESGDAGYPTTEEAILEYNRLKRQFLRITYIPEEVYLTGSTDVPEIEFDQQNFYLLNDGHVMDEYGNEMHEPDRHVGNLLSGMGQGGQDIRYIRNWEEETDYCVQFEDLSFEQYLDKLEAEGMYDDEEYDEETGTEEPEEIEEDEDAEN